MHHRGLVAVFWDGIHLGNVRTALWSCLACFSPVNAVIWPQNSHKTGPKGVKGFEGFALRFSLFQLEGQQWYCDSATVLKGCSRAVGKVDLPLIVIILGGHWLG